MSEGTSRECTCDEWVENITKLNTCIDISRIHGVAYHNADRFEYCPWCGEKL